MVSVQKFQIKKNFPLEFKGKRIKVAAENILSIQFSTIKKFGGFPFIFFFGNRVYFYYVVKVHFTSTKRSLYLSLSHEFMQSMLDLIALGI